MQKQIYLLKKEIIKIGRIMYEKDFVASNDGNITIKVDDDLFLATPTGISKGFMTEEMLLLINSKAEVIQGNLKPSSEIKMHLEVYKNRSDVNAVVHAHPTFATAFAINNIPLAVNVLPEIIVTLGSVPVAKYATPSTEEVPAAVREYIKQTDAMLLANHGVLTVGKDVWDAYFKLEQIEHYAKILFFGMQLGNIRILSEEEVNKLKEVKEKLKIQSKSFECSADFECSQNLKKLKLNENETIDKLSEIIKQEILKYLK
ncbi:MAG TPA: class II aldolase/adducin family protein [bacterium]|nr:class II aldolase/adducin family protein [bacterium]